VNGIINTVYAILTKSKFSKDQQGKTSSFKTIRPDENDREILPALPLRKGVPLITRILLLFGIWMMKFEFAFSLR
jgi:hypothetical protein